LVDVENERLSFRKTAINEDIAIESKK
jgi:hypothetical protein